MSRGDGGRKTGGGGILLGKTFHSSNQRVHEVENLVEVKISMSIESNFFGDEEAQHLNPC